MHHPLHFISSVHTTLLWDNIAHRALPVQRYSHRRVTAHVCSALSVDGTGDARPRPDATGFYPLLAGSGRPRVLVIAVLVAVELVLGETCGNGASSPALLLSS